MHALRSTLLIVIRPLSRNLLNPQVFLKIKSGPHKSPARCSPMVCPFSIAEFPQLRAWPLDAAGECDGLPGLGPDPDGRERLRSFRLRFSASICLFFFFTEGFW